MKLYDEVALPEADDEAWAAADVIETFEPSAKVSVVVVEPSLLETAVLEAPSSACSRGSELEPSLLPEPLEPPTW